MLHCFIVLYSSSTDGNLELTNNSVDPSQLSHISSVSSYEGEQAIEEDELPENPSESSYAEEIYESGIYKCANCAIPFNKRKAFMRHIKHRKNRCSNCCRQAASKDEIMLFKPLLDRRRSQTISWHSTNSIKRVECQNCQWECCRLGQPGDFDRLSKTVANGPYRCDLCPNSYSTDHRLAEHIRLHAGDRSYRCTVCNKSFYYEFNLTAHSQYHWGVQLYQCIFCLKNCAQSWVTAKVIVRSHVNAERRACEVCYKTAIELDTLMKRYTPGPKAHGCIWCSRRFATAYSWIKHVYKRHLLEKITQAVPVVQPQNSYHPTTVYGNRTTVIQTTASETTTRETTASETTENETTAIEATASETTASETTAIETTATETSAIETSTSEATAIETTESETNESETTERETNESETNESETTDSETSASEMTESETTPQQTEYLCEFCGLLLTKKYLMDIHKKIHLDVTKLNSGTGNRYIDDNGDLHTNYM